MGLKLGQIKIYVPTTILCIRDTYVFFEYIIYFCVWYVIHILKCMIYGRVDHNRLDSCFQCQPNQSYQLILITGLFIERKHHYCIRSRNIQFHTPKKYIAQKCP